MPPDRLGRTPTPGGATATHPSRRRCRGDPRAGIGHGRFAAGTPPDHHAERHGQTQQHQHQRRQVDAVPALRRTSPQQPDGQDRAACDQGSLPHEVQQSQVNCTQNALSNRWLVFISISPRLAANQRPQLTDLFLVQVGPLQEAEHQRSRRAAEDAFHEVVQHAAADVFTLHERRRTCRHRRSWCGRDSPCPP